MEELGGGGGVSSIVTQWLHEKVLTENLSFDDL